jgi:hypothetical protein
MGQDVPVRYRVEHFRALESSDAPLGYAYVPTGEVHEVEAHGESEAAALVLTPTEDTGELDVVGYDPANGLYGLPGEDEAVRVTAV